jgi:hypothetical protein
VGWIVHWQEIVMTTKPLQSLSAFPDGARSESSLVRRLVRAKDDPAKQRIRAWLCDIDDKRLRRFGLSAADIAMLRGPSPRKPAPGKPARRLRIVWTSTDANVLSTSLRAKRSNPGPRRKSWIASSHPPSPEGGLRRTRELLAMTGRACA